MSLSLSHYVAVAKKQDICMRHVASRRPCYRLTYKVLSKILVRLATLTPAGIIRKEGKQLFGKSKNRKRYLLSKITKNHTSVACGVGVQCLQSARR